MSIKLTSRRALLLSSLLVVATAPGCSIEDFDVDGDGQVTRAEALYAGFLWLCEEIPGQEEPEEPAPEEPVPEEPTPEEPLPEEPTPEEPLTDPTDPTDGLAPDPADPLNPF